MGFDIYSRVVEVLEVSILGSIGKHFLIGKDSAVLPSAFPSVLSCARILSCLKHPTEKFQLWEVRHMRKL